MKKDLWHWLECHNV